MFTMYMLPHSLNSNALKSLLLSEKFQRRSEQQTKFNEKNFFTVFNICQHTQCDTRQLS